MMEKRGRRDSAIFDDNFVAMHSRLAGVGGSIKAQFAYEKKKKYTTTYDSSLFLFLRSSLCSLT